MDITSQSFFKENCFSSLERIHVRIERNWQQQDLADQLGTTISTIQRWERGTQQPGAYFRVKLCTLFEKRAQELGLVEAFESPPESTTTDAAPDVSAPSQRNGY